MFDLARDAGLVAGMASATAFASAEPCGAQGLSSVPCQGTQVHSQSCSALSFFSFLKSEHGKATPEDMLVESSLSRHARESPG